MVMQDLTGQRFGKLTVLERVESQATKGVLWRCRCDCGNECFVLSSNLRTGHTSSCGCKKQRDLTGQRFGKLTVLCMDGTRVPRGKRTCPAWKCQCDCGAILYKPTDGLTNGGFHACQQCTSLYAAEKMREKAGFVNGTQLSRLKNLEAPSSNTSGVRGVYYDRRSKRWRARLKIQGKLLSFGSYEKFEEAVEARKKAEEIYFKPLVENEALLLQLQADPKPPDETGK